MKITYTLLAFAVLSGCAIDTKLKDEDIHRQLIVNKPLVNEASATSYVRLVRPEDLVRNQRVNINAKTVSVMDAITDALQSYNVIPGDANVDLRKEIAVYANDMSVDDYLKMVTGLTDYHFTMRGNTIYASSIRSEQWNLASLATRRTAITTVGKTNLGSAASSNGGSETNENSITIHNDDDAWEQLIEGARAILGVDEQDMAVQQAAPVDGSLDSSGTLGFANIQDPFSANNPNWIKPYVAGIRQQGILRAAGSPYRMSVLDDWLQSMTVHAQKQVRLDIQAFDVTLSDSRGRGIDWSAIYSSGGNNVTLGGSSPVAITGAGVWSIAANTVSGNRWNFEAMFDFLGRFGEVNVQNQPSLTVVNGYTAMIANGDMFSYIASIERTFEGDGVATVTPLIQEMRVGLSLSVTPRVLDGDRILIEVVPIISSVQGFDNFNVGDYEFSTPNIALQELSTSVIARHGETIQLGGLISRRIAEQVNKIPFMDETGNPFNYLFSSVRNELERRELVLAITPRLLDV